MRTATIKCRRSLTGRYMCNRWSILAGLLNPITGNQ